MIEKIALKTADLMSKAFTGKTLAENNRESLERYACSRLVKAHQLCLQHRIELPTAIDGTCYYPPELLKEPAVQNYLHQLGFTDAVHGLVPQTVEPHYALGYEEGRHYE